MFIRRALIVSLNVVLLCSAAAGGQGFQVKWVCEAKAQRLYRKDLGVVCWDGQTYRAADPGGIPQYMLDYFSNMERELDRKVKEMRPVPRSPTIDGVHQRAAAFRSSSGARVELPGSTSMAAASARVPVPAAAPATPPRRISPEVFASIGVGTPQLEALEKLGKASAATSIPNDDGMVEIWSYSLTDGSIGKVRIESGIVASTTVDK